ncbi:exostosin family protein [Nonlabens sp. Asnod3-A02]|uniref:exostosin domain-containing protein n=1 Tax=Nonlabens sp. Asnod3-A02 TaxID=3160579 RepID=UPI0038655A91
MHPLLFDLHYYEHAQESVFKHYEIVLIPEQADVFIFPVNYLTINEKRYESHFNSLYQLAKSQNKKLLVYTGGDYGKTFNDPNIITWRNAGFKRSNDENTLILPAFMSDPLEKGFIDFKLLEYKIVPHVSFTGFATASFKEQVRINLSTLKTNLKRLIKQEDSDYQKVYNAAGKRFSYLQKLERSTGIKTDFIYRDKYRAGSITVEQREKSTREFFENLNSSPYTFCLRGAGNFSVRFFESLALGRIPILIDTDVQLPLEGIINWDKHICRVSTEENLTDAITRFHTSHDRESFIELQNSNRRLYERYLNRHAYLCEIHPILKSIL